MAKKKWVSSLEEVEREWLSKTAGATGVNGSDVISELIRREMSNKASTLKDDLRSVKKEIELKRLNDQQLELEARREALLKDMAYTRRTAQTV